MSINGHGGGVARPGFRMLTAGLLLSAAVWGLYSLESQIQVFGFGASGPDARSFPRLALWLLAAVVALRLVLSLRSEDVPLGNRVRLGRVLAVTASSAAALWVMPQVGFFFGAAGAGIVVALTLGERRPLLLVLPLIVAAVVTLGGRHGLNIPLP
ncbi:tripartite tricarboxylate transporter TctB family protein [Salipiger bermudensis]|uniref:tripartite tricarboxylate transporter TctB family protein n=1 Tax=Salipiger bermudensis TaxID=344736 RepID=UPI001CD31CEF|nr:tripartite tricarboxylate transporter TctB family protein [Salipiger bermudensis]MCA0964846.1 tripartite tricarboxylate transporter TctB family protein [Salipiger bermudensis]